MPRLQSLVKRLPGEHTWRVRSVHWIENRTYGPTSFDEAKELFREQAQALLDGGIDLFVLETFSDISKYVRQYARSKSSAISRSWRR